ncbi:MAG TPA: flagellar biosynthesis protein FlgL [Pseudolabrys sp.]|jgi:flagellar hook-associated protein 3 FlgL|nr:flagellar biosynthesis protein FlgL [Pseudolabrys sp.]
MSVSSIGAQSALIMQQLVQMRSQFDDLQRQLGTGQKSATYAGLGINRGVTVSLNSQLSAISGYDNTIDNVMARINLMNTALGNMIDITTTVKSAMVQANGVSNGSGALVAQQTGQSSLDQLLALLNAQAGDRYLFSGRATNTPAVETLDHIMNGDGARAGLKQLIFERNQADLGIDGLGRLTIGGSGNSVQVDEQATSFGLKLASITSTVTGATVSGPTGSPASESIDFSAAAPNPGETTTLRFNLPDGTSENLTLTATTDSPPGSNEFTIGTTPGQTASNFQTALTTAVGKLAGTSLTAASAVAASSDFFNADANNPPQRVGGSSPFYAATGMVAGTAANTVIWYTGETGTDPARSTATAKIDQSLSVSYGARANEDALRTLVQNVATLAAVTISPTDPNGVGLSSELDQRLTANLGAPGTQTVTDIESDLASAQTSLKAAKDRHQQANSTLNDFLQQIEGVSNEDVGAQLLTLQTRMQASMQVTSMLSQLSLVNFLK